VKLVRVCALAGAVALSASCAPVPSVELNPLVGTWEVVSHKRAGVEMIRQNDTTKKVISFSPDGTFNWIKGTREKGKIVRMDRSMRHNEIDYVFVDGSYDGETQEAIYKLEGNTFTDCFAAPGHARPTEFESTKENGWDLIVYKRVKQ
jgi:uncharacterized protein (TIGR03067 family)